MAHERTPTSRPRRRWMRESEFPDFTDPGDEVDLNASPNMAHLQALLEQPYGGSSSMIGGDYSYDFPVAPPPPPRAHLSHLHEEPAPHIDDSQRPAEEEVEEEDEDEPPAATANPSSSVPPRRKKLRSEVWQHFDHAYECAADGTQIRWAWCKLCRRKFNANSTTGTTALKNHHRRCQAEHDRLVAAASAATGTGAAGIPTHVGPSSQVSCFDPQAHREALVKYIIGADMPLSLGEHPSHIEYVRSIVPNYQPVTRNTIRSDLEKYYRKRRAALLKELENGTFNVAFTSDVWSGRARKDYISVVIHSQVDIAIWIIMI